MDIVETYVFIAILLFILLGFNLIARPDECDDFIDCSNEYYD